MESKEAALLTVSLLSPSIFLNDVDNHLHFLRIEMGMLSKNGKFQENPKCLPPRKFALISPSPHKWVGEPH